MNVSPEFFELQIRFAIRAGAVAGLDVEEALLRYTNIYVRLGCGVVVDPSSPRWRSYLGGITELDKLPGWTYELWERVGGRTSGPVLHSRQGCFGFTRASAQHVHLHFVAGENKGASALSPEELPARASELRELLSALPADTRVHGRSWMYNLKRYRSLFPYEYLETAVPIEPPWQRLPLWGQLLHADGSVRQGCRAYFLDRLALATDEAALQTCFRYPVYELSAPAAVFQR